LNKDLKMEKKKRAKKRTFSEMAQSKEESKKPIKKAKKSKETKEAIFTENSPAPIGPYSQGIVKNDFLFISGQIALNAQTGKLMTKDIKKETALVMRNLKGILTAADMDFSHVIKATIFLKDMNSFPQVNKIYEKEFKNTIPPARECVQVSKLPKDVNVEISMIAHR
jgi:2-iminobutanoate/2-iminopropanoate deaminase